MPWKWACTWRQMVPTGLSPSAVPTGGWKSHTTPPEPWSSLFKVRRVPLRALWEPGQSGYGAGKVWQTFFHFMAGEKQSGLPSPVSRGSLHADLYFPFPFPSAPGVRATVPSGSELMITPSQSGTVGTPAHPLRLLKVECTPPLCGSPVSCPVAVPTYNMLKRRAQPDVKSTGQKDLMSDDGTRHALSNSAGVSPGHLCLVSIYPHETRDRHSNLPHRPEMPRPHGWRVLDSVCGDKKMTSTRDAGDHRLTREAGNKPQE